MKSESTSPPRGEHPHDRFVELGRKVMTTPKSEVDERDRKWRRKRKKRKSR